MARSRSFQDSINTYDRSGAIVNIPLDLARTLIPAA